MGAFTTVNDVLMIQGRVVEVYGPEASGKTTLALHVIAEAQKSGGLSLSPLYPLTLKKPVLSPVTLIIAFLDFSHVANQKNMKVERMSYLSVMTIFFVLKNGF